MARARGYDEAGESRSDSDDSDASYDQHGVGGEIELRVAGFASATLACDYHRKYFVTAKSLEDDPYHFEREDTYIHLSPSITFRLPYRLGLELAYSYTKRDAFSSVEAEIEEVKDYTCNRVEIRLVTESPF